MEHGSPLALPAGEFLGNVRRRHDLAQFVWVELEDAPRTPWHTHEEAYVCLPLRGVYCASAEGWREGEDMGVLFHPAGTTHRDRFLTPGRSFNVSFHQDWLDAVFARELPERPVTTYEPACVASALRVLREGSECGEEPSLEEELVLLLSAFAPRLRSRQRTPPAWIARAKHLLAERCEGPVRIGDLALEVGVHPVVLARGFRRHEGCTPLEFLRWLRVQRALGLLRRSSLALAEISLRAGFSDQAQCTRAFRRVTGWTPGALGSHLRGP